MAKVRHSIDAEYNITLCEKHSHAAAQKSIDRRRGLPLCQQ